MRDFFIDEVLDKLYAITGNEQIKWMRREPDGAEQVNVMIDEMVKVCSRFGHIPDQAKKEHILTMLIEDQDYKNLSAKQIWKWLHMISGNFGRITESELIQHEPATKEQRDYWAKQFFEGLDKIGNRPVVNGMKQLRESKGYESGITNKDPRPVWIVGDPCPDCKGDGFTVEPSMPDGEPEQIPCMECDLTGKINRYEVHAISQEVADKVFSASKNQGVI